MRILQFVYCLPPHVGGLDQIVEQFSEGFIALQYGDLITVTSSIGQERILSDALFRKQLGASLFFHKGHCLGYRKNDHLVLVMPSFELLWNFPCPSFWKKSFRMILTYSIAYKPHIIQTHMRFFLLTLLGGILSKFLRVPWIVVEHSSNFASFTAGWKNRLGWLYDQIIGKRVFTYADVLIATSEVCRTFIKTFAKKKPIHLIYRGLVLEDMTPSSPGSLKEQFPGKIIMGVLGRLVYRKNIHGCIQAYYSLPLHVQQRIQLVVVGGGEEFDRLQALDIHKNVYFTGEVSFQEAINYQSNFDIYVHPSLHGGALAGTILQAMWLGNLIVATPNEGAGEVITDGKNGILLKNDSVEEISHGMALGVSLLSHREERAKKNQEIIRSRFAWKEKLKEFVSLYRLLFIKR